MISSNDKRHVDYFDVCASRTIQNRKWIDTDRLNAREGKLEYRRARDNVSLASRGTNGLCTDHDSVIREKRTVIGVGETRGNDKRDFVRRKSAALAST